MLCVGQLAPRSTPSICSTDIFGLVAVEFNATAPLHLPRDFHSEQTIRMSSSDQTVEGWGALVPRYLGFHPCSFVSFARCSSSTEQLLSPASPPHQGANGIVYPGSPHQCLRMHDSDRICWRWSHYWLPPWTFIWPTGNTHLLNLVTVLVLFSTVICEYG